MESSQSSASAAEREAQLLGVGKQCTHVQCMLVDFLPFRCHYCQKSFCQEHFKVEAHQCSQYDETKYNRIAPNCPMCNTPVAIKLGQDPNARMEEHFSTECTAMTGRGAAKSTPTCAKGNCKKVLYTPIKCDKCKKDFCASHRFPTDHNCSAASTAKTVTATRLGDTHPIVAKYMALSNARKGTTTAKRTTAGPGTSSKASTSKTSTTLSVPSPFNKTDRLSTASPTITNITTSNDTTAIIATTTTTTTTTDQYKRASANNLNPYIPRPFLHDVSYR